MGFIFFETSATASCGYSIIYDQVPLYPPPKIQNGLQSHFGFNLVFCTSIGNGVFQMFKLGDLQHRQQSLQLRGENSLVVADVEGVIHLNKLLFVGLFREIADVVIETIARRQET